MMKLRYCALMIPLSISVLQGQMPVDLRGRMPLLADRVFSPYSVEQSERLTIELVGLYAHRDPPLNPLAIISRTTALLLAGTNINDFEKIDGYTPLHMALANKDIDYNLIDFLLNNGANVFAATTTNESTIAIAARYDRSPEIIRRLLDAGADPSYLDIIKNTPLNHLIHRALEHLAANDTTAYAHTIESINLIFNALFAYKTNVGAYANAQASLIAVGSYGDGLPSSTLNWLAYLGDVNLMKQFLFLFGDMVLSFINQKVVGKTAFDWANGNNEMQRLLRPYGAQSGLYVT